MSVLLSDECQYSNYNLSTQRLTHQVHPHAYIKMADFHAKNQELELAAKMYSTAALKGFPQVRAFPPNLRSSKIENPNMVAALILR